MRKEDITDDLKTRFFKLHALANQKDSPEEAATARAFLDAFLKKNHLKESQFIATEELKTRTFYLEQNEYELKLFFQLLSCVRLGLNTEATICTAGVKHDIKVKVTVKMTEAENIEFWDKYQFYLKDWRKQLEAFYTAFLSKNHIFSDFKEDLARELTDEEAEIWERANKLKQGIDRKKYYKAIETGHQHKRI